MRVKGPKLDDRNGPKDQKPTKELSEFSLQETSVRDRYFTSQECLKVQELGVKT